MGISIKQIVLKKTPLFTRATIYHSRTYKSSVGFTSATMVISTLVNALSLNPNSEAYTSATTRNSRPCK